MKSKFYLSNLLSHCFSSSGPESHWFGYYNYSPVSADGKKLLSQRVSFDGRPIEANDTAEVGYFNLEDGVWHGLAVTKAINWQQGSMLQWMGPDYKSRIIFNDAQDGQFVSRIYDVERGQLLRTIPFAIYGLTPDGRKSISLKFERCYWCRAYHYESVRDAHWDGDIHPEDGIFAVDLLAGKVVRILSMDDVFRAEGRRPREGEKHWLEHIILNASGNQFAFYHRFGDSEHFRTIGLTADVDGGNCQVMPFDVPVNESHLNWIDDNRFAVFVYRTSPSKTIGAYARVLSGKKSVFRELARWVKCCIKCLVPRGVLQAGLIKNRFYAIVDLLKRSYSVLPIRLLPDDGHPSFTRDGRFMLTDTYADAKGYRHLLLYDCRRNRVVRLGRFYSPFNCCGYRADLHPRFSFDEKKVIIDSAHSGRHQIYVYNLKWEKLRV